MFGLFVYEGVIGVEQPGESVESNLSDHDELGALETLFLID